MAFKMIYDERNRQNINKLADNTKIATLKWYQYCIDNEFQILIYETIRTVEQQKQNVANGASQTMKSYHIVGQALDFVFVDSNGSALWSVNEYVKKEHIKAINYAKSLGFTWGGDWDNDGNWRDETFLDSPHLQFEYNGYGTDTFGKLKVDVNVSTEKGTIDKEVSELEFTSSTLKVNLEGRVVSKATMKLIDDTAQELLGYKSKLKDGKLTDGDLLAMAVEIAVKCGKEHKK